MFARSVAREPTPRERDIAATKDLYQQLSSSFARCGFATPADIVDVVRKAILNCSGGDDDLVPIRPLLDAFFESYKRLLEEEQLHRLVPLPPDELLTGISGARLRDFFRIRLRTFSDEEATQDALGRVMVESFLRFHNELPRFLKCAVDELDNPVPASFMTTLLDVVPDAGAAVHETLRPFLHQEVDDVALFASFRTQLYRNLYAVNGHNFPSDKPVDISRFVFPSESELPPRELVHAYLKETPFENLLHTPVPFAIPQQSRFEHTQIVAGSGHGKTQTLQHLLLSDLTSSQPPAIVIIDSQGDLIRKISHLKLFEPEHGALAGKLVIIDPTDVEHPPALNMFDVGTERLRGYGSAAREQVLNGVIELYDYLFGSLLGSELTQKQSVVFRYLARLMLTIPGATIHDLLNLMTDVAPYKRYIDALPAGARAFFETEFSDRSFAQTKKQIQRRLWGILENPTLERMFTARKNRIDMFEALNSGKVVLVNTAKDFLKGERSSFLGRFFICLTLQAVLERAVIPENKRRPAFLYIDEAAEYFDDNIDDLLSQARKYNLGVVFAHQYLDQLAPALRASIAANASIKLAGGVSTADARSLAPDMRTTPDFLLGQRKGTRATSFGCYVRNFTSQAIGLAVPFGTLERQPRMSKAFFESLLAENRARLTVVGGAEPKDQRVAFAADLTAMLQPKTAPEKEPLQAEEPGIETREVESEPVIPPSPPKQRNQPTADDLPGRGGRQHKYIQHLLHGAAQQRGYHAIIEAATTDGAGQVDLLLTKGKRKIACEITVTTGKDWELGNVKKCLSAGFDTVILVSTEKRNLKSLSGFIEQQLDDKERKRMRYLTPDEVIAYLDELEIDSHPAEQTVRGYKVKVSRAVIDPEQMEARRDAIAKVLAKSMQKGKRP
jgi:hypothetical protein